MKHYIASAVLAASLAGSVSAQDWTWTGGAGDGLWSSGGNWNQGTPPPATGNNTFLGSGTTITLQAGETQSPGLSTAQATVFGPEWGGTLNIYGTLNYNWYLAPIGASGTPSTINMFGNASITGEGVALGHNWWFNGGPYVNMNLHDDATVNINWFFWGGHLNLAGGTFNIAAGLTADTVDQVSDSTRLIDITEGTLVLGFGDQTALVNDWISRGILQAYGGTGHIVIDIESAPGQTIVSAVPEPSSLALWAAGGAFGACLLRRRKSA